MKVSMIFNFAFELGVVLFQKCSVLESAGVTSRFHDILFRGFFLSCETRGFSLHILAPFLTINNVVWSTYTFSTYRNKLTNFFKGTREKHWPFIHWGSVSSVKSLTSLSMTFLYFFNVRCASLSAGNLCQVSHVSIHDIFIYFLTLGLHRYRPEYLCQVSHVSIHDIYILFYR
jgi:hypothetical protein